MSHFTGYGAYQLYMALRLHFNSNRYNFFKMNGKLRLTKDSFRKRTDKSFFEQLSKTYNSEDLKDYYIANFLEDKPYVTALLCDSADHNYLQYRKRRQSLRYNFKSDLELIPWNNAFKIHEYSYPEIVSLYLQRKISIETMVILSTYIPFKDKFDTFYSGDFIWPKLSLKMEKYSPFLKYDRELMKRILKESLDENFTG